MQAINRHPELLAAGEGLIETEEDAELETLGYQRTGRPSEIHPRAKAHREWQEFKHSHWIKDATAKLNEHCIACGEQLQFKEPVLRHEHVGSTHLKCAEWWREFDFTGVPTKDPDEIPF